MNIEIEISARTGQSSKSRKNHPNPQSTVQRVVLCLQRYSTEINTIEFESEFFLHTVLPCSLCSVQCADNHDHKLSEDVHVRDPIIHPSLERSYCSIHTKSHISCKYRYLQPLTQRYNIHRVRSILRIVRLIRYCMYRYVDKIRTYVLNCIFRSRTSPPVHYTNEHTRGQHKRSNHPPRRRQQEVVLTVGNNQLHSPRASYNHGNWKRRRL